MNQSCKVKKNVKNKLYNNNIASTTIKMTEKKVVILVPLLCRRKRVTNSCTVI